MRLSGLPGGQCPVDRIFQRLPVAKAFLRVDNAAVAADNHEKWDAVRAERPGHLPDPHGSWHAEFFG